MKPDLAAIVARFAAQLVPGWQVTAEWRAADAMPMRGALATCEPTPTRSMARVCVLDPWPEGEDIAATVAHELTHACLSPLTALLEKTPAAVMLEEQAVENIGKALAAATPGVAQAALRAVAKYAPRIAARLSVAPRGRAAGGEHRMDPKLIKACIDAIKSGDSAAALKCCEDMLVAATGGMPEPDGDEAPPAGKAEAPPPVGDKPADGAPPAKDDEKKPEPAARKAVASSEEVTLARRVQELEAREAQRVEDAEREKLFAERPDFAPETRAVLARASLETLRDAVKNFPRVGAVRAQTKAPEPARPPTRGAGQGDEGNATAPERVALDEQMGVRARAVAVRHDGHNQIFPAMTPEQARAARMNKEQTR